MEARVDVGSLRPDATEVAADPKASGVSDSFLRLAERLATASVRVRWEAHRDVVWDSPEMIVDGDDPRWELPRWDPMGASPWYLDQPPGRRAAIGLHRTTVLLKAVIEFETRLQQGLLLYAAGLPNRHPAFRYVYHEISEEAQHTMMFQELIDRSGFDPQPEAPGGSSDPQLIATLADEPHAMFFLRTLAGEESFDHLQRRLLRTGPLHPLMAQISRIHCAEEARHLSFARAFVKDQVPRLTDRQRRVLAYQAPVMIDWIVGRVLDVPLADSAAYWQIPTDVAEGIATSEEFRSVRRACVSGVVDLCRSTDLLDHRLEQPWRTRCLL